MKNSASAASVPLAAGESNFTTPPGATSDLQQDTLCCFSPMSRARGVYPRHGEWPNMPPYMMLATRRTLACPGIICETASVHLASALPNFRVMECECDISPFKRELTDLPPGCLRQKDGTLDVPGKPGLGIEIDWSAVKEVRAQ